MPNGKVECCLLKLSGNMLVGQEVQRHFVMVMMLLCLMNMGGMTPIQNWIFILLEPKNLMHGGCMICMEMLGNGVMIGMENIRRMQLIRMDLKVKLMEPEE